MKKFSFKSFMVAIFVVLFCINAPRKIFAMKNESKEALAKFFTNPMNAFRLQFFVDKIPTYVQYLNVFELGWLKEQLEEYKPHHKIRGKMQQSLISQIVSTIKKMIGMLEPFQQSLSTLFLMYNCSLIEQTCFLEILEKAIMSDESNTDLCEVLQFDPALWGKKISSAENLFGDQPEEADVLAPEPSVVSKQLTPCQAGIC